MADFNLTGFGEVLKTVNYKDNWDWFVQVNDWTNLWKAQPTYLISQLVFVIGSFFTLIHALSKGGRWPWLWLGTILHGIVVETLAYNLPDIDNFWHSQTPIVFLGGRFPLHIVLLYSVFLYHAAYGVSRLQLPSWAEPFAVGLTVVLIDIPYDIVAVKFLHWTWHDTDPNIKDRHYWVPWNSYYFHATFAASFTFWFHLSKKFFGKNNGKWQSSGFFKELGGMVIAGVLGMPGGVLLFLPIYHPLHDFGGVHSEVTFFMIFAIFLMISWSGDRTKRENTTRRLGIFDWLLVLHLVSHYAIYLAFTILGYPEREISIGYHEPIGSCKSMTTLKTAFGTVLQKRKYLCVTDYDEDYFDFSCLPKTSIPGNGAIWYTACGTPFRNRVEYIAILSTICFLAAGVFYNYYFRTVVPEEGKKVVHEKKKKYQ